MSASYPLITTFVALLSLPSSLAAQTPAEVRSAFKNLRSDHILHNCSRATDWLFVHREALKDQMVQELYVTDRQGRDALLHVLFHTESFVADDRFRRFVMARIPEEDSVVRNTDIACDSVPSSTASHWSAGGIQAHWEAWDYIDTHFKDFEPLLKDAISHSHSMFVLWGTTWMLANHHVLKQNLNLYTDEFMGRIASNLKNDHIAYNAGQAVRIFLLLGKYGIPTLQHSAGSADTQMASLSRALIDAIQYGKHEAFGYMNARVEINLAPVVEQQKDPPWLDKVTRKYWLEYQSDGYLGLGPDVPYP
jgi:hypothetical protein